ncbi:MAG: inositol monophosphatase [Gammaproteobacteria bacterium]|nr:inositol monophosphatase [Gammaproteobacteria bacterium]MBA3731110.1 inositol monophosphatase [Gammaproteobacteria bacterium]
MSPQSAEVQCLVMRAGDEELLPRFEQVDHHIKADGSVLTEADLAIQQRLRDELEKSWPEIAFLSEEMPSVQQAKLLTDSEQPLWCLDPLDGTSNFATGLPCFGISLALLAHGEPVMGIIYDPTRRECFRADKGAGARLNGRRLSSPPPNPSLARTVGMVDFKRLPAGLARRLISDPPYASQRNFGSSALEWAWVAAGRGHVYLHGGQKLWDFAAGSLILTEAGGFSCTLAGEPVFKSSLESRSVIAASGEALFRSWRDWLMAPSS